MRDGVGLGCALAWIAILGLFVPCEVRAQTLSVEETEDLVRSRYFEGLPEDQASQIGPEGAARLVEMLADPGERANHDHVLLALGLCGAPGAFDAIADWAQSPRTGDVDRDAFKAWQALPYALGHLSRHDPRAFGPLEAQLAAGPPRWRFRHHRGGRLARLARHAAANALAETGSPEARRALDRAVRNSTDPEFDAHLRDARARHAQRVREQSR
ncbi:MAG: hypothetical protein CL908_04700 [Deltaproteobacteria bacterium]|nr:hypothetical protein [Deltaproteobacteria bacterium]